MAGTAFSKFTRSAVLQIRPFTATRSSIAARSSRLRRSTLPIFTQVPRVSSTEASRPFSTTRPSYKGLSPESENPQPKEAEEHARASAPADITVEQYNALSDDYMNTLLEKLEQLQEEREDVDVEYSAGVLTLHYEGKDYVINKQPPNKQIWLSSPISGPKRYDFVMSSEGQDAKEGTGAGDWVYLRDGTSLTNLLVAEVGVDLSETYVPVLPQVEE